MSHLDNGFRSLNLKRFRKRTTLTRFRRGKRRMNICCNSWMGLKSAARF